MRNTSHNPKFAVWQIRVIITNMRTVQEIEAALPKLSRTEIEEVRALIDDFLVDQMELTDEVKTKLDQAHREIAAGQFTTRQPL